MNMVSAIDLSRYIFAYIQKTNHLKLQKLIYYVDAWHLVFFDAPLIKEDFEAWVHGPVVRQVWDCYKKTLPLHTEKMIKPLLVLPILNHFEKLVSKQQLQLINDVLDEYGSKTSYELELYTHNELPWREARQGYEPLENCSNIISKKTMHTYYSAVMHSNEQEN